MTSHYYNEFNPEAAAMLRQFMKDGLIPHGDVDERSITEVTPDDVKGYTQCHFFAGIAGWQFALQQAGWEAARPVWTGSCPCQPFSSAGKGLAEKDERHLAPAWLNLVKKVKPKVIFGEQVASAEVIGTQLEASFAFAVQKGDYAKANKIANKLVKIASFAATKRWLDDVHQRLEEEGYSMWASVLPASAVGAPHKRDRLWFVADSDSQRLEAQRPKQQATGFTRDCEGTMGHAEYNGQPTATEQGSDETSSEKRRAERTDIPWKPKRTSQPRYVPSVSGSFGREREASTRVACNVADTPKQQSSCNDTCTSGKKQGKPRGSDCEGGVLADTEQQGLERHRGFKQEHDKAGRETTERYVAQGGFWDDAQWLLCPDGKARPVEPSIPLLVDGFQHRKPILHAIGNAIVPQVAAEFIMAYDEARKETQ